MTNEFIFWVLGTLEDTPIPYEVQQIFFCLHRENGDVFLSFGGNEKPEKLLLNFEWYPLDAQYFAVVKTFSLFDLRKLVETANKNPQFLSAMQEKTIFFGVFGTSEIYKLE